MREKPFGNTVGAPSSINGEYLTPDFVNSLTDYDNRIHPWRDFGPYVPFPNGVNTWDFAGNDIGDPPLLGVCFNEQYAPLVMGALKALGDPRLLVGPIDEVLPICDEMAQLPGMVGDVCAGPPLPELEWDFAVVDGTTSYHQYYPIPAGDTVGNMWIGSAFTLEGHSGMAVVTGGNVFVLDVVSTSGEAVILVTLTTCLDEEIADSSVGTWSLSNISFTDIDLKRIVFACDETCVMNVQHHYPIVCIEA